jgi:hypothetical protein
LHSLFEPGAVREDSAQLDPNPPVAAPSEPFVADTSNDQLGDLGGDGGDIHPAGRWRKLAATGPLQRRRPAIKIDGPVLHLGPRRAEHRPTVALDLEAQNRRLPFDLFHSTDQLTARHATVIATEVAPDVGE